MSYYNYQRMKNEQTRTYKCLDLLIIFSVMMMVITMASNGKIVKFLIFTPAASALYFPFTYLVSDLLTEVYGFKQARRALWIMNISMVLAALIFQLVVFLPPAPGFQGNEAFNYVLGQTPRIAIGGIIAYFVGQFLNDFVLAKMKIWTKGKYLWTRTIGSTLIGQFADTSLFYLIALSNYIPANLMVPAIFSGWFLKVMVETLMTPVTYYVVGKLKKLENEDYYDRNTNFNPLIVNLKQSG